MHSIRWHRAASCVHFALIRFSARRFTGAGGSAAAILYGAGIVSGCVPGADSRRAFRCHQKSIATPAMMAAIHPIAKPKSLMQVRLISRRNNVRKL
jgi:hypothetical protein